MFIDQVNIHVRSGKGGDGMVHFRREKFVPLGGPDGGDGGRGGNLIFEVQATLNTLSAFRQNERFAADDGKMAAAHKRPDAVEKTVSSLCRPGLLFTMLKLACCLVTSPHPASSFWFAKAAAAD
ncbi:hypothetical protein [Candidatus Villigracilis proximus]|uniref:hypothetical protein n=1 Tax=Candidatus Villigracilis proximus TaxID=3140683 RepID=UPI0031EECD6F